MTHDFPSPSEDERRAVLLARTKARGSHIRRRRRILVGASTTVVAAAMVVTLVAVIPTATPGDGPVRAEHPTVASTGAEADPVTLLARGVQLSANVIPWPQVGPGWTLATWVQDRAVGPGGSVPAGAVSPAEQTMTLFLVNPIGGRYAVTTFPPGVMATLAAWSGDGRRALLVSTETDPSREVVTEIDLTTGGTLDRFTVDLGDDVSYAEPDGLAVLVTTEGSEPPTLERLSRAGVTQLTYPSTFSEVGPAQGGVLSSPDGTEIVMGAARGLALVDNDGTVVRQLPLSGNCDPERWWSPGVVLASCSQTPPTPDGASTRLWLVPASGASPRALESANPDPATDLGDLDAWPVGGTTFVQATGACGSVDVARLAADGTTTPVTVPDVGKGASAVIDGTYDGRLAVQGELPCGAGETLVWFNPATDTTNLILGPPLNGGGVTGAIVYPDDKS